MEFIGSFDSFYTGVTQTNFGYASEIHLEPQQEVIVLARLTYALPNIQLNLSQCFNITTLFISIPEQLYDESGLSYPSFEINYPYNYFSSGWYKITNWPSSYVVCSSN